MTTELCECGRGPHVRRAGRPRMGCAECIALDGDTPQRFEMIQILRECSRMTTREIAQALGKTLDGTWMLLSRMESAGYLCSLSIEADTDSDRPDGRRLGGTDRFTLWTLAPNPHAEADSIGAA